MRLRNIVAVAGTALAMCAAGALAGGSKLHDDLPGALAQAQPGELVPVIIVMAQQAEPFDLNELRAMDKASRRHYVLSTLQQVAAETQGGVLAVLDQARQAGHADNISSLWISNVVSARVTPEVAYQLAKRADVDYLNYDRPIGAEVFPVQRPVDHTDSGNVLTGVECGVNLMHAPTAWSNGITGAGVVVGMVDTGVCITHPDISGQIWTNPGEIANNGIDDDGNGFVDDVHGWSFDGGGSNNNIADNQGHGSHTAGTVAGDGTQGTQCGMAPDARIQVIKFWNSFSGQTAAWNCMQYGAANGADVESNSYGWPHSQNPDRKTWRSVTENIMAAGVVLVFAAGNEGSCCGIDSVRTPGDVPDMITVGATDCNMNIASFSSRGPVSWTGVNPYNDWPYPPGKIKPSISAPGVATTSHNLCNGYIQFDGTSMATPHVAGAVALMLQANPNLDHFDCLQILRDTAIDRGATGDDNTYGMGFVDAWAAVQVAQSMNCPADFNGDGSVNTLDVLAFLNAWNAHDSSADFNGDGSINTLDVSAFLNAWVPGC